MISIEFRFPAGRYHATPWNRQVNEGIVEWPPNPWRIARAIISTYYLKMNKEYDDEILRGVVQKLGSLPVYLLPPASLGHTRHYMPLYGIDKSSMIFDTFVSVKKNERLIVSWPYQNLDKKEIEFLSECLKRLQYLGRAESWVEATIVEEEIVPNCVPAEVVNLPEDDLELVDVIVPMSPAEYVEWSDQWNRDHSSKKKNRIPKDIFDALIVETTVLKKDGWNQPPGSKWVQYLRRTDCFDVKPEHRYLHMQENKPTVARYQVASQAPPRLTDAISVAERVHTALVSYSDQSRVFTGCDDNKVPLEGHDHAHIFCESNRSSRSGIRGEITHVTLFASEGFGKKERKALDMLRKVWGYGGHDIQLVLLGVGEPDDFAGFNQMAGQCPLFVSSREWISRTPFVSTTHPKTKSNGEPKTEETSVRIVGNKNVFEVQKGSPAHDVLRLLKERGYPEPESIEEVKYTNLAGKDTYWLDFRRERKTGNGKKGPSPPTGFRIRFKDEVKGPIALGFGSHFGLGLFVPDDNKDLK